MMASAKPPYCQWLVIAIVMGINLFGAANLASFFVEFPCLDGPLDSEVCFILGGIGTAPVGLPSISF